MGGAKTGAGNCEGKALRARLMGWKKGRKREF